LIAIPPFSRTIPARVVASCGDAILRRVLLEVCMCEKVVEMHLSSLCQS
jgi:hypothetical protein